ncbi:MAG: tetratricopeptide repeat protein [candidate division KSB1 bacterium]|nr:tetratricopeptide repeat protein [candidate division KSB1 bacterium]
MESLVLILLVLATIAITSILVVTFSKKRTVVKDTSIDDYIEGLNQLIAGNKETALEKLKETVRKDTNNINAYIKIGDIYRELGRPDRAVRIHRELTIRRDLNPEQRLEILKSLLLDFQVAKRYDRALLMAEKILEIDKKNLWAHQMQLKLYEEKQDWDKAFEVLRWLLDARDEKNERLLALYKVQAGLRLVEEGREREGRIKFREAMKLDETCAPAYLYLGDSYIRENRTKDALEVLRLFIKKVPRFSFLAFDRMKDVLFEVGSFGELETIYETLLHQHPDVENVRFALAEIYEKKGEINRAIALCEQVLETEPNSKVARLHLVKYYYKSGQQSRAMNKALRLIDELLSERNTFHCKVCGWENKQPFWHCPQCHQWDTCFNQ